jgi:hypothetical protein
VPESEGADASGNHLKLGKLHKWREPKNAAEEVDRFRLIEMNPDRSLIRHELPGWKIQPTMRVNNADIELAEALDESGVRGLPVC